VARGEAFYAVMEFELCECCASSPRVCGDDPSATRRDSNCASAANQSSSSEHLENGLQHAADRAVRAVFAFVEPAQTVEVREEFVGAIDEVNDHFQFAGMSAVRYTTS